jgi:hypothetical protein
MHGKCHALSIREAGKYGAGFEAEGRHLVLLVADA